MFNALRADAMIEATEPPIPDPTIRLVIGENIRLVIRLVICLVAFIRDNFQNSHVDQSTINAVILPREFILEKIAAIEKRKSAG
jgi:hypothetical protein